MFSERKVKKKELEPSVAQNRINEGTVIKGDITSTGFFRIDGSVEGNIKTPSKLVLGKLGSIFGTLHCDSADIEGKFNGNLQVSGMLTLRSTAVVEGDVVVGKLAVEQGATMNASCVMREGADKVMMQPALKKHPFAPKVEEHNTNLERQKTGN